MATRAITPPPPRRRDADGSGSGVGSGRSQANGATPSGSQAGGVVRAICSSSRDGPSGSGTVAPGDFVKFTRSVGGVLGAGPVALPSAVGWSQNAGSVNGVLPSGALDPAWPLEPG